MKFKPQGNYVLIQQVLPEDDISIGGIVLPHDSKPDTPHALVLAIGPDVKAIKVDDRVMVHDAATLGFFYRGRRHGWVREDSILGIVEIERIDSPELKDMAIGG